MTKLKRIFVITALVASMAIMLSACNKYSFLSGTWRNEGIYNDHTEVWFSNDQTTFKYQYQNGAGGIQEWEGTVKITKNSETDQISIKLVISETSSFSFVVKSDEYGKTYLDDGDGQRFYKV